MTGLKHLLTLPTPIIHISILIGEAWTLVFQGVFFLIKNKRSILMINNKLRKYIYPLFSKEFFMDMNLMKNYSKIIVMGKTGYQTQHSLIITNTRHTSPLSHIKKMKLKSLM